MQPTFVNKTLVNWKASERYTHGYAHMTHIMLLFVNQWEWVRCEIEKVGIKEK